MADPKPVALVTGASSGVGRATARARAGRGWRVFGTSRSPSDQGDPFELLPLDVRDDASVAACVAGVTARAGRIDLLVNNAGFEQAGALEELSLEEARAQFETNFFGVVRMVKEVLPLMRGQRSGRTPPSMSMRRKAHRRRWWPKRSPRSRRAAGPDCGT